MRKLLIFIIIVILACLCVLFFYNIQLNAEIGEILFLSRGEARSSFLISYKQGIALHRVTEIANGLSGWKLSQVIIHSAEDTTLPFEEGETLVYDVYYAGLKAGQSTLKFHGEKTFNGGSAYYITFVTELPFFKDHEDIYAEKGSFLPLKISRRIEKMGGLSAEEIEEEYDQAGFKVNIKKKGAFSTNKTTIEKNSPIYNAILLTYFCRANPGMANKDAFKIVLPTQEFNIRVSGEDKIETPSGQYLVDVFTSEPSKFTFYLSKDKERLPVKITSHTTLNYTMILNSRKNKN